jgi:streptogramin lyase
MRTGAPAGEVRVEGAPWLNDLEVADDGTIYATQTGDVGNNPDPTTWRVWKITPDGMPSVFVQGAPLRAPNGVAFDPEGNVVVANFGNAAVLTFSPSGELVRTEEAAQPGSDGLVIMPDGTKYVSSVTQGGVSRIRPGAPAELIARNIPTCRVDVLRCGRQPAGDPDEPAQRPCVRAARVIGGSRQRTSRARRVQTCSP